MNARPGWGGPLARKRVTDRKDAGAKERDDTTNTAVNEETSQSRGPLFKTSSDESFSDSPSDLLPSRVDSVARSAPAKPPVVATSEFAQGEKDAGAHRSTVQIEEDGRPAIQLSQDKGPTARRMRQRQRRQLKKVELRKVESRARDASSSSLVRKVRPRESVEPGHQAESGGDADKSTGSTKGDGELEGAVQKDVKSDGKEETIRTLKEAMGSRADQPSPMRQPITAKSKQPSKIKTIAIDELEFSPLQIDQPPVPRLSHGLDRVLFNNGVYNLQDQASRVYNFDPYLQKIMPVAEFDFNALKEYKTSSQDTLLSTIARQYEKKYVGSTSSMTGTLGHFHYLVSNWRDLNTSMLSRGFPEKSLTFTEINRVPNAMFLRWKDGTYAIDADKQYDGANVLMLLGKSLEKLLTMTPSDFERYRKSDPREVTEAERTDPESYHYSMQGDFLMRSQLDAYDPRLPGTGTFDLKTRAVLSVRMRSADYQKMSGYQIHTQQGQFESYEREYYDMMRSTLLKYSLQARMGRMDGIFMAYHNVERIFGFQYMNINQMDEALHGQYDRCLGDQEFSVSIELLNKLLNKATEKFPKQVCCNHQVPRCFGC